MTVLGTVYDVKLVQPAKKYLAIVVNSPSNVTEVRLVQFLKKLTGVSVIFFGIVTEVRPEQP